MADPKTLDSKEPLNSKFLPSKILILLMAACLGWIALLSLAFMLFLGKGVAAGWIFAGALFLALAVWAIVMFREFRLSFEMKQEFDEEDCIGMTASRPRLRVLSDDLADGRSWILGRLNMTRSGRPGARRKKQLGRSRVR